MKSLTSTAILLIAFITIISCKSDKKKLPSKSDNSKIEMKKGIINVTAKDFKFNVSDTIPSGWLTFKLKNEGIMDHFFFLTLLPEGETFANYVNEVGPPFENTLDSLNSGKIDKNKAFALLGRTLPKWYGSAILMGGSGIISGGLTAQTTLKLIPGNYVMECYIKASNGQFHSTLGMINPLTVTSETTTMLPPKPNVEITLTNSEMKIEGNITSGKNTFAVHFKEHPELGLGNDINLIKVDENTNLDKVSQWMDWMNVDGLRPPSPAIFLGGTQEMPVGYTSYFTCNLTPGKYAFVAETPIGRFKQFSVK